MKKVIWGTGTIGLEVFRLWKRLGVQPDYFCDNDSSKWDTELEEIRIVSPDKIFQENEIRIYIACNQYHGILRQILAAGVSKDNIVIANSVYSPEMISHMSEIIYKVAVQESVEEQKTYKCLVDLSGGMVLGGVERWSYSLASIIKGFGITAAYVVPSQAPKTILDNTLPVVSIPSEREEKIVNCIKYIMQVKPKYIICNFPFEFMQAACIVKKYYDYSLKIIAVLHNDEELYYRAYLVWNQWIDKCLVISSRIRNYLLEEGMPEQKIENLLWNIECPQIEERNYSSENSAIRIGYAGRVTKTQKRLDCIIPIACLLKKRRVDFQIQIAGIGDYADELRQEIKNSGLEKNIELLGYVEHKNIFEFWLNQDICLSCSEWEGHSITQLEAMSVGTVPVLTNTSGVEDDVQNGINGFVVEIGDIEAIAECISRLFFDKAMLIRMGQNCINERKYCTRESHSKLWRKMLGDGETYV